MKAVYTLGFVGLAALSVRGQAAVYGQCGGKNWTGPTTCVSGATCVQQNAWYYQCVPATSGATTPTPSACTDPTTTSAATTPTQVPATSAVTKTRARASSTTPSASATPTGDCATPPASAGKLRFAGVNIAGFDFGVDTNGDGSASSVLPPLTKYGVDGPGQMSHFVNHNKYNIFRLPTGWQYLTGDVATGTLDNTYFSNYNTLVQHCLSTGAHCVIDIHNYARFNGGIIGQGGPSDEVFASLWSSLASYYAKEDKVIFGLMNEPHDLPSLTTWAKTVQAAVTAIRNAGATAQIILLPSDNWTSAKTFVSGGSAEALSTITNPDGSQDNLVFDVHLYLDSDSSGTSDTCVSDHVTDVWESLAPWLRCHGRQALLTETGGGNTPSCEEYMCNQIQYLAHNSDAILGYAGWAAGSFSTTYTLSETPTNNGGTWTDSLLVQSCMAPSINGLVASD